MNRYYHNIPQVAQGFSTASEFLENQAALEGDERSDSTVKERSRTAIQTGFSRGSGSFPRNGRVVYLAALTGIFRSYVVVEQRG